MERPATDEEKPTGVGRAGYKVALDNFDAALCETIAVMPVEGFCEPYHDPADPNGKSVRWNIQQPGGVPMRFARQASTARQRCLTGESHTPWR
jgi:hypothetical protein